MLSSVNFLLEEAKELVDRFDTPDILSAIYSCIDLTDLSSTSTYDDIKNLCLKVNEHYELHPSIPNVAAICVCPSKFDVVAQNLDRRKINIACVAGGFPHSHISLDSKLFEIKELVSQGVDEIDIVINVPDILSDNSKKVAAEIGAIKKLMGAKHLKVILQVSYLNDLETIYDTSLLCLQAGADFIKTSTGKENSMAFPEAAIAMCLAIKEHYENTGEKRGIKPAGGISTVEDAALPTYCKKIAQHVRNF